MTRARLVEKEIYTLGDAVLSKYIIKKEMIHCNLLRLADRDCKPPSLP